MAQRNVTGRTLTKGCLSRISDGQIAAVFTFQYNPSEVRRSLAADWQHLSAPGADSAIAVFGSTRPEEISFMLLLDAREDFDSSKEGIRGQLAFLESMVLPDPSAYVASPGLAIPASEYRLTLGNRTWPVVCTSLNIEEKMWARDLAPVRAEVNVSFRTKYVDSGATYVAMQTLVNNRARVSS